MNADNLVLGLLLSGAALLMNRAAPVKENFGMLPPRTVRVERMAQPSPSDSFYTVPGNYQSALSPIGGAGMVDYGALIRYNLPDNDKLRTADYKNSTPVTYLNGVNTPDMSGTPSGVAGGCSCAGGSANMVRDRNSPRPATKEGYCSSCACTSGIPVDVASSAYEYQGDGNTHAMNMRSGVAYNPMEYTNTTDLLPVPDTGNTLVNALGETVNQPIVYDRFIYANQKSRLLEGADFIRGDLPIVPIRNGWFRPSVNPQIDLRQGAMMVLGGANNDTSQQLLALQNAASGGTLDVGSGVNYALERQMYSTAAGGDINVSAFP